MAMSDSNPTTTEWGQFYHHHTNSLTGLGQPSVSESTVITSSPPPTPSMTGSTSNIEGRVGKSAPRRRSRASRKAPTTMLNTDTANFRAMVQQFTGIASGSYSTGLVQPGSTRGCYGVGLGNQMMPYGQEQQQQYQRQQQQYNYYQQQQQQQPHDHLRGFINNNNNNNSGGDGLMLRGGFNNINNPRENYLEMVDGFLFDGIVSGNRSSGDGYLL